MSLSSKYICIDKDDITRDDYIDLEQLVQKELDKVTSCYEPLTNEADSYLNYNGDIHVETINEQKDYINQQLNNSVYKIQSLLPENNTDLEKFCEKQNSEWNTDLGNEKLFSDKSQQEVIYFQNQNNLEYLGFCDEPNIVPNKKSRYKNSEINKNVVLKLKESVIETHNNINNDDISQNSSLPKKELDLAVNHIFDNDNLKDLNEEKLRNATTVSEQMSTCRLCADNFCQENIMFIYDDRYKSLDLEWKINTCLPINVKKVDNLPQWICENCYNKVNSFYVFSNNVLVADRKLKEKIDENSKYKDSNNLTFFNQNIAGQSSDKKNNYNPKNVPFDTDKEVNEDNKKSIDNSQFYDGLNSDIEYLDYDEEDLIQNLKNMSKKATDTVSKRCLKKILISNNFMVDFDEQSSGNNVYNIISQKVTEDPEDCLQDDKIINMIPYSEFNNVSCYICNTKFLNALCTIEHSLKNHSDKINSKFHCSLCETATASLNTLRQHIIGTHYTGVQTKYYPCKRCKKKFSAQNSLERHSCDLSISNLEDLICKYCNIIFPTKIRLNFHKPFHTNGLIPLYCVICRSFVHDEGEFFDHVKNRHGARDRNFKCLQCDKIFPSLKSIKTHEKVHTNIRNYKCETCGKMFFDKQTLTEHSVTHMSVKPFQCHICGKYLNRLSRLKGHLLRHESDMAEPRPVMICKICSEAFSDEVSAMAHDETCHMDEKISKKCVVKMISAVFRCEFCEKCFSEKSSLKEHMTIHNEENPYICHICSARFSTYTRCTTHKTTHGYFKGDKAEKDVYPVVKHFVCNFCDKDYLLYTYLNVHRRLKHSDDVYVYKCHLCTEQFATPWAISYHRKKAHNIVSNSKQNDSTVSDFNCGTCNIKFDNNDNYVKHMLDKHPVMLKLPEGEEIHQCDECGKIFNRKESLIKHIPCKETKSSEQTSWVSCRFCNEKFINKKVCENHIRQKHKDKQPFECELCQKHFRTKNSLKMHMRIHANERPFSCTICGFAFRRPYALKIHKMSHENLKPFSCKSCPKRFPNRIEYQKHVTLAHNDGFILLLEDDESEKMHISKQQTKTKKRVIDEHGNVLIAPKVLNKKSKLEQTNENDILNKDFSAEQITIPVKNIDNSLIFEQDLYNGIDEDIEEFINSENETFVLCNDDKIVTEGGEHQILIMTDENNKTYYFDENNQYVYNADNYLQTSECKNEIGVLVRQDEGEDLHYYVQLDDAHEGKQFVMDECGNIILN